MIKLAIILLGIILLAGGTGAGLYFGLGNGGGNSEAVSEAISEADTAEDSDYILIKVEESSIWIDDAECENIEALKDMISKYQSAGNTKEYLFEYDYAIKSTYDDVKKVLSDLEQTLGITVKYN